MQVEYLELKEINGGFVALQDVHGVGIGELVRFVVGSATKMGHVVELIEDIAIVQVFEGSEGFSLQNTKTIFLGTPMEIKLSKDILGRTFDGIGRPIDGLGEVFAEKSCPVFGLPINPLARVYPRNFIQTGISAIDGLCTLIRGQKLPIFSGSGLPHDKLAAQIIQQATIAGEDNFAVVFAGIGIKHDQYNFFRQAFETSGILDRVVTFLNLASDPVMSRVITPKAALTVAEYLAFEKNMHVLVVMTDITAFAEALREISSGRGEIPSRKGYPGYLYSELSGLFERAGVIDSSTGSVTQLPIITMPNDDITHPIPDLTGYITEGQIVLDRALFQKGLYPPINILPSLSRLMKDGIGEGTTTKDHFDIANQVFSSYAKVGEVRALASVIGEEELSDIDKKYLDFAREFEEKFLNQRVNENRTIRDTINLSKKILKILED